MNCGGFYLSADFLYWRSENHGFSYAYELETTNPIGLNVGSVLRVNPDWEPAFRVGAGWNTNHDFWDVFLNYTWYRNHSKQIQTSANGFIPLWPVLASATGPFGTVAASTHFVMNMGDLEVGRKVYLTESIAIRPHWGARGGTLHQKFSNNFGGIVLSGTNTQQNFNGRNYYWGVGPRTGVHGEFHLARSFSLLGQVAGTLLYGKTEARSRTQTLSVTGVSFQVERQYTDHFYQLVPNLQLSLGFQWQTCLWCETMFFKMSAAWETNYWWDQFNLPFGVAGTVAPFPTIGNQPLTMEGLTVNLEWNF